MPQRRLHQLVAYRTPGKSSPMLKDNPTTVYIYPESHDIDAVSKRAGRGGSYWNASCLREIGSPKLWPKETLEPILARYREEHPAAAAAPPRNLRRSLEP